MYPQATSRTSTPAGLPTSFPQEVRESSVGAAVSRLNKASQDMLGVYDTLSKRLGVVSRMEPEKDEIGNVPEPSTNCQLADDLNSATSLLESLTRQMRRQIEILEV